MGTVFHKYHYNLKMGKMFLERRLDGLKGKPFTPRKAYRI